MTNFGWEYVWHCHILSHEEMDMMRPITLQVPRTVPDKPVLTVSPGTRTGWPLTWTDGTPVSITDPTTWGNPKNEIGYRIESGPDHRWGRRHLRARSARPWPTSRPGPTSRPAPASTPTG